MTAMARKVDETEHGSRERRDLVSGDVMPDSRLIRFVASPDGVVVPDVAAKLPGRGLWVAASKAAIATAVEKKLFSRAAKAQVIATTRVTVSAGNGGVPGGRVLSRSRPLTPCSANRRCQRHTAGRLTLACLATSATASRLADSSTICARCTCLRR